MSPFAWLLDQPEFIEGRFHTTYLDELLTARSGRPFVEVSPEVEEVAAIAAALQAALSPAAVAASATADRAERRWKTHARVEGLRSGARPVEA